MSSLPPAPWCDVSVDFVGPLPSGYMLLVVTDDYSIFPEVEIIKPTSAKTVIPNLDNIFSRQGIPQNVQTDNGPPFQGENFRNFGNDLGFTHRRITTLWPQANGEVERFVDTLLKAIRTAHIEQKNWKQKMYRFLRQYRATPQCAAAEALHNSLFRTQLQQPPADSVLSLLNTRFKIQQNDEQRKQHMKQYADNRRNARYI